MLLSSYSYVLFKTRARFRSSSNACIVSASNPPANCNKQAKKLAVSWLRPEVRLVKINQSKCLENTMVNEVSRKKVVPRKWFLDLVPKRQVPNPKKMVSGFGT